MSPSTSLRTGLIDQAKQLDSDDPLRAYRSRFDLPEGVIYLDGNSLGALPKATKARIAEVVGQEWGEGLIRSWNSADWITLPQRVGGKIAPLIGAQPHEVIACDSTSVNLSKLIAAALHQIVERGGELSTSIPDSWNRSRVLRVGPEGGATLAVSPDQPLRFNDGEIDLVDGVREVRDYRDALPA